MRRKSGVLPAPDIGLIIHYAAEAAVPSPLVPRLPQHDSDDDDDDEGDCISSSTSTLDPASARSEQSSQSSLSASAGSLDYAVRMRERLSKLDHYRVPHSEIARERSRLKYVEPYCGCLACIGVLFFEEQLLIIKAIRYANQQGNTLAVYEYPDDIVPSSQMEELLRSLGYTLTRQVIRSFRCNCPGHESCRCHGLRRVRLLVNFGIQVYSGAQL